MIKIKGIIFDFNRTIYNPETEKLTEGARELLEKLRTAGYKLAMVTGAKEGTTRATLIKDLGLESLFDHVEVAENHKSEQNFKDCYEHLGLQPEEIAIVGDRVKREILIGNKLGMTTIRYKSGKFRDELPETEMEQPNHIIKRLKDVLDYI